MTAQLPDEHLEIPPEPGTFAQDDRFRRDLAEVHILIDFISGRTDKSLDDLKGVEVVDDDNKPVLAATPQKIVEEICKISYPPSGGSIGANARQAALMLVVKDRLNRIADPARGLTVAFTEMFAGVSGRDESLLGRLKLFLGISVQRRNRLQSRCHQELFSAQAAYPHLEQEATHFWRFYIRLPTVALAVIVFIVWVNWDVNVTSSMLQQIIKAHEAYSESMSDKTFVPTQSACNAHDPAHEAACSRANAAQQRLEISRRSLQDMVCGYLFFLHPVALGVRLFTQRLDDPKTLGPQERAPLVSTSFGVIGGLNSIIIPTLFGWLGTMASLLRSITAKVRERILSPRDYGSARVVLFLGMLAGLAVGLFYNTGDASAAIGKGFSGTITVSTAGLSFLAGFGAEPFFAFLDGLLIRLFPVNQSAGNSPGTR